MRDFCCSVIILFYFGFFLQVNDMDMKGVTREEAVLFLLSLQDQIDLIVQHRKDEYDVIVAGQRGDSFHIKYVSCLLSYSFKCHCWLMIIDIVQFVLNLCFESV